MKFSRKIIYGTAVPVTLAASLLGTMGAASAGVRPLHPAVTAVQLKDGRALDMQYGWQWNAHQHRWVYQANGKVIVDRLEGRWDFNRSEDFQLVYGPAGKMAYIQYIGPGQYHDYYVQTSDRHGHGMPAFGRHGFEGSKLVKSALDATIFTVSAPGPAGFRTMTVPAVLRGHGPEILTGEAFGQLGLNPMRPFALPTSAQLFAQRLVIPAHW